MLASGTVASQDFPWRKDLIAILIFTLSQSLAQRCFSSVTVTPAIVAAGKFFYSFVEGQDQLLPRLVSQEVVS